jgi:hypothetical protein
MQRFEFLFFHNWLRRNKPIDFGVNRISGFENNYVICAIFNVFFLYKIFVLHLASIQRLARCKSIQQLQFCTYSYFEKRDQ